MDHRERWGDAQEAHRIAMDEFQSRLWTALPCIVHSFDPVAMTIEAQPAIGGVDRAADGVMSAVTLPLLQDVPVIFPRGGGCTLTFPVAAGDECLVIFSSRPIDAWWQSGGVQRPASARMHDLADGFAFVGPMSQSRVLSGVSTTQVQLRTDDGQTHIAIDPGTHAVDVVSPASITLTAPTVVINGLLQVNGPIAQGAPAGGGSTASTLIGPLDVTGDVTAAGKSVSTHHHNEHDGPPTSAPV
jgi:hypothetical protein